MDIGILRQVTFREGAGVLIFSPGNLGDPIGRSTPSYHRVLPFFKACLIECMNKVLFGWPGKGRGVGL